MRATNLLVSAALLLSATSATLAQDRQCSGDRPYYDYDSAGWLDDNFHPGVDCNVAPRVRSPRAPLALRVPAPLAGEDRSRTSMIR